MAHRKVYVSNWDEALDAVNGKEYVLDGIHGHLKVTRSIDRFGLPVTSFVHEPSRKGKTSEAYLERRRELGDDRHTDFRDSERAGTIASEFCEFPATDAERAGFTQRKKTDKAFPIGARVITRTGNRRGTVVNLFPMREVTDGFPYRATPDTVAVQWDNGSKGFDHRLDLVLEKADSSRHPNTRKAPERKFWTLTKAPMSKAGYQSGRLTGLPIWEYVSPKGSVDTVRAEDREHAKAFILREHPEARFSK